MNPIKKIFDEIQEIVVYCMEEFSIITGLSFILMGFLLLKQQLKKENSFKMSDYTVISWRFLVSMWSIIYMLFSVGLILIFNSI